MGYSRRRRICQSRKPSVATLSGLTIGSLTLAPEFDPAVREYTAETENATNKITATPADESFTVTILNGETPVENGGTATWETGENTVTVTVSKEGYESTVYTVVVTAS